MKIVCYRKSLENISISFSIEFDERGDYQLTTGYNLIKIKRIVNIVLGSVGNKEFTYHYTSILNPTNTLYEQKTG